jgi:hypothetical protein
MDDNRSARLQRPGAVPDENAEVDVDVGPAVDTDGDGLRDTLLTTELTADGVDLLVHTDLDADGLADRVCRIGPDGAVRAEWTGVLGRLFGPDP